GRGRVAAPRRSTALDLRHDPARRIEEDLVREVPAAELADREQARGPRVALEPREYRRHHRPVAVLPEDRLRRRRVEEAQERLRLLAVLRGLDDRGGVLDQDRLLWDEVVD